MVEKGDRPIRRHDRVIAPGNCGWVCGSRPRRSISAPANTEASQFPCQPCTAPRFCFVHIIKVSARNRRWVRTARRNGLSVLNIEGAASRADAAKALSRSISLQTVRTQHDVMEACHRRCGRRSPSPAPLTWPGEWGYRSCPLDR